MSDEAPVRAPATAPIRVDVELVRQLAELLDVSNLNEIEVEDGERKIRVARTPAFTGAPAFTNYEHHAPAPAPSAPVASAPPAPLAAPQDHPGTVKSPMVGTVYLAAEPGAAPFVAPGKAVAAGETLLIVEAMKVMNPIVAPRAGTVRSLLVENGQPVEFDQPLVVVE